MESEENVFWIQLPYLESMLHLYGFELGLLFAWKFSKTGDKK